jgi:hypothetical protein
MSRQNPDDVSLDAKLIAASNFAVAKAVWHLAGGVQNTSGWEGFDSQFRVSVDGGMEAVEIILNKLRAD